MSVQGGVQSLDGKVAIVSGSSSGIGAAVARELASRGASVVINYPFESLKDQALQVQASLEGATSIAVQADLSTIDGPSKLVAAAVEAFGTIDILVNNAAISVHEPLEDVTPESWEQIVNLNGRGTLLLTQAVLKHLSMRDSRIVNICSASSQDPPPGLTVYAGTKGMVESFTRVWARELPRRYGCTVNSVAPGPVNTEGMSRAPAEMKQLIKPLLDNTPVAPRMAETSEISWAVAMLCEKRASWINGLYMVAGGGLYLT